MDNIEAFPDIVTAATSPKYQAIYFDVLGRLARLGLILPPQEFEDLKNDFLADVLKGLEARYDPACGSPFSYIYGAFLRFARQRIIRSQKWRTRLRDMAGLADQVPARSVLSPIESLVQNEELEVLQQALSELPLEGRTVLLDYFASGPRSQRQLARKYGKSRYQLHELLINGFGQLVVRLAGRGAWPLPDREVAFALWCEGWDLEETAARLGRPIQQVRETRERLKKLLASVLANRRGGGQSKPPPAIVPDSSAS
jgi:RNA polymerase sigma factor (sigma-70 family)